MPYMGLGILAFSFGAYWDDHYRGRPFYADRGRWQQSYTQNYRPAWGGGAVGGGRVPGASAGRPGGYQHQGIQYQAPQMRAAPTGNWGAHQGAQHQEHAAPVMRAAPARQAAPAEHGGGQQHGGGGGEQGHARGGAPAERPQDNPGGEHGHGG
jgi:hypothetical protein